MHLDHFGGVVNADTTVEFGFAPPQHLSQSLLIPNQQQMQVRVTGSTVQRRGHDHIRTVITAHGVKRNRQLSRHRLLMQRGKG